MKRVAIKKGLFDDSFQGLILNDFVLGILAEEGYSNSSCCTGGKKLIEKNYTDDTQAASNGVLKGQIYHTNGVLKLRFV